MGTHDNGVPDMGPLCDRNDVCSWLASHGINTVSLNTRSTRDAASCCHPCRTPQQVSRTRMSICRCSSEIAGVTGSGTGTAPASNSLSRASPSCTSVSNTFCSWALAMTSVRLRRFLALSMNSCTPRSACPQGLGSCNPQFPPSKEWHVGCFLPKLKWLLPSGGLPRCLRRPQHPEDGWCGGTPSTSVFGVAEAPLIETADKLRLVFPLCCLRSRTTQKAIAKPRVSNDCLEREMALSHNGLSQNEDDASRCQP